MTMMDLGSVKKDFSALISQIQPWTLSHFVMWLDIKVAEYKVFGRMIMDNTPNDTPQWLRVSAEYMMEQQKEAMKNAAAAAEVSVSPVAPVQSPPSAHTLQRTLMNSTYEPITSFATSASSLYTVSTVNSTVVSPSVSPAYSTVSQTRQHSQVDSYHKQTPTVESAELYAKASPLSQFSAYTGRETGRIPPISHLSPKHIRQSHLEHNMSMALPVSLTPVSLAKDIATGKESLSAAEVETQIAVLQSQIAAVNRNLQASQTVQVTQEEVPVPVSVPVPHPTPRQGRRKAASTDDATGAYVPPPYPKKTRQQSPVSNRVSTESALPPLHSSMDIMSRLHRLDTESIPESLRSQNIQSTLEAFEALRTQTFPPNPEVLRTQIANEIENIQNTAQDMSIHHVTTEREQVYPVTTEEYTAVTSEREQSYPSTVAVPSERDQTYQTSSSVHVKVEQEISDNDSEASQLRTMSVVEEVVTTEDHTGAVAVTTVAADDNQNYTAMYASPGNSAPANTDEKLAADISTKKMRRKFLESMKNSNPKYYSHQIQQIIPFPDKFPVASLDYGLKALQMIQTGEITRAGKIQLIDTIFHELIKYTGLYPTPTQKMAVANSIVETFPTLAAKMKASHISPADSWYVILCDKFRNERRGLGGTGSSPRVGKTAKMVKEDPQTPSSAPAVITEPTEEATVEIQTSRETPPVPGTPQEVTVADESSEPPPAYEESPQAYQQTYQQPPQPEKEVIVPESSSDMEEDEGVDKLLMNTDEKQQYADRVKRSYRRKTQSPKRHVHPEMPILDERYAASLLEYYSKHKPYYPGEADGTRHMELEISTTKSDTALDEKSLASSQEMVSGRSSVSGGQYNGQEGEGATEDEVAAIVQSVVSAHMDEVLAARQYKQQLQEPGETYEAPKLEPSAEPKSTKKQKVKLVQKEKTPEQCQLNQQRFVQKVALTYPGVAVVDESTLLCKCGVKVKLGRARMLHNYTNYHLKRCQNPPIPLPNVKTELAATPPLHLSGALLAQYAAELNMPLSGAEMAGLPLLGHKSQSKDRESPRETSSFTEPPEKEKVQVIKNYPLNIPVPSSEMLLHGLAATAASNLNFAMPLTGASTEAIATQSLDLTIPASGTGITTSAAQSLDLTMPVSGLSATVTESLDLSVPSSSQTALIESSIMSTVADLRMNIPSQMTAGVTEYSELPELTAMNALSIIQGKADETPEPAAETAETESEEPINLADS